MNSPLLALAWEIWRRGRRSAWLALACLLFSALLNFTVVASHPPGHSLNRILPTVFGLLMVLSFLLLMGIFNYTEFNASKDWNGFPYRLFILPVPTWQLVALPMVLCVATIELLWFAWIVFVWPPGQIPIPGWFSLVLGTVSIFYQTSLWALAGFRVARVVVLSLGGVFAVGFAWLPFMNAVEPSPWRAPSRLIPVMLMFAVSLIVTAWVVVARQRSGGGLRRSWFKTLVGWISDLLPRRQRDFVSPRSAQLWYEWRRTGWLLPLSTFIVLAFIVAPISWFFRKQSGMTQLILLWSGALPFILAFVIGKGFIKCEFWSRNLALPPFLAVRPLSPEDFVLSKLRIAAFAVAVSWFLVLIFLALWIFGWANTTPIKQDWYVFRLLYPHSWLCISFLALLAVMILSWRCLVSGLWIGLSGKASQYYGITALQIVSTVCLLIAAGVFSDAVDQRLKTSPDTWKLFAMRAAAWSIASVVIIKAWLVAFLSARRKIQASPRYLMLWLTASIGMLCLAALGRPVFDAYRLGPLYLLGALLTVPIVRVGLAPGAFVRNRHR